MTNATHDARRYTFHIGKDKPNKEEQVDGEVLKETVARMFPDSGANIQEQTGTWKGEVESGSWRVEHIDMEGSLGPSGAREIREELEEKFEQDMVLVTSEEVQTV